MCHKQLLPFAYFPLLFIFCLFNAKIYMIPHKSRSYTKIKIIHDIRWPDPCLRDTHIMCIGNSWCEYKFVDK